VDIVHRATTATPYQRLNLGVIPNTDSLNPNTLNYFGALENFRLYGRELGNRIEQIQQDQANFDWFLTKQGDNGFAQAAQVDWAQTLPQNPFFKTFHHWSILGPEELSLDLYQRARPSVTITPLADPAPALRLDRLEIPAVAPPGQPLPVTYQWAGAWQDLNQGLVLITWQNTTDPTQVWFGDHAMGLGQLLPPKQPAQGLQILEHTALLPPATLPAGTYRLRVEYLDRRTGQATPIVFPATTVRLDPATEALAAPPVDYVSQLRNLSPNLASGIPGLDPIFQQIDRLNLYDPTQDYLKQADASLSYRLSQNPTDPVALTYALVLSRVLQQNPPTAIAALQSLVQLDRQNPYAHAYLAFVYLYNWQGYAAEQALAPALALAPNNREIHLLLGIAKVMQGNLWGAWQTLRPWL
jgi:4-amino-4-deoxy-L-arabinose transferase-like glycosyltransferase